MGDKVARNDAVQLTSIEHPPAALLAKFTACSRLQPVLVGFRVTPAGFLPMPIKRLTVAAALDFAAAGRGSLQAQDATAAGTGSSQHARPEQTHIPSRDARNGQGARRRRDSRREQGARGRQDPHQEARTRCAQKPQEPRCHARHRGDPVTGRTGHDRCRRRAGNAVRAVERRGDLQCWPVGIAANLGWRCAGSGASRGRHCRPDRRQRREGH